MSEQRDTPRPKRRISRYQRAQDRRDAQKRADQKFYNTIFSVIGACVLVVLGLAMIASSGSFQGEGASGAALKSDVLTAERFLGLTALEWGGLALVAVIGVFMWRRINKR